MAPVWISKQTQLINIGRNKKIMEMTDETMIKQKNNGSGQMEKSVDSRREQDSRGFVKESVRQVYRQEMRGQEDGKWNRVDRKEREVDSILE